MADDVADPSAPGLQRPNLDGVEPKLSVIFRTVFDNLFYLRQSLSRPQAKSSVAASSSSGKVFTGPPTTTKSWTIAHNLNSANVIVQLRQNTTFPQLITGPTSDPSASVLNANTIQINSASNIVANSLIVCIIRV